MWLHVQRGGNAVVVWYRDPVAGYGDMAALRNWADTESGWTQDRALAEVAFKRELLRLHGRMSILPGHPMFNDAHLTRDPMSLCRSCEPETMFRRTESWPCRTLRALAAAYADRPGYAEAIR